MISFITTELARQVAELVYGGTTLVPPGWEIDTTFGVAGESVGDSGGYAYALKPLDPNDGRRILAFRGTEVSLTNLRDVYADVTNIGRVQFDELRDDINRWLAQQLVDGNRIELVGHSLGGALVQWAINDMNMRDTIDPLLTSVFEHARQLDANFSIDPSQLHFTTFNAPGIAYVAGITEAHRQSVVVGEHHVIVGDLPFITGDPIHLLGGPHVGALGSQVVGHQVNFEQLGDSSLFAHWIDRPLWWDLQVSPLVPYSPPYLDIGVAQAFAANFSQLGNTDGTVTGDAEAAVRLGLYLVGSGVALGSNTVALAAQLGGLTFDRDVFASVVAAPVTGVNDGLRFLAGQVDAVGQNVAAFSALVARGVIELIKGLRLAGELASFLVTDSVIPFLLDTAKGIGNAFTGLLDKATDAVFDLGRFIGFVDYDPFQKAYAAAQATQFDDPILRLALEEAKAIVERAGQVVVVQQGAGPNPFDQQDFNPDIGAPLSTTVQEGYAQIVTLYLPYAAGVGGQRVQLRLEGTNAEVFTLLTSVGELTPQNGEFVVTIPEGERAATVGLRAKGEVSGEAVLTLSATLLNGLGQDTHTTQLEATLGLEAQPPIDYANGFPVRTNDDFFEVVGVPPNTTQQPLFDDDANAFVMTGDFNDIVHTLGGNDVVRAGPGNDQLYGDEGHDTLFGEEGHDRLYGGSGNDQLAGNYGEDVLIGDAGDDSLFGDITSGESAPGVPFVYDPSQAGADRLEGGEGDDFLSGDGGADILLGGAGQDVLWGDYGGTLSPDELGLRNERGNDILDGGPGHDVLVGMGGEDLLDGGDGDDLLFGDLNVDGPGYDPAVAGDDVLIGGQGNDTLQGHGGDDILFGGPGDDVLWGDDPLAPFIVGRDYLDGGDGNDELHGNGEDTLLGGSGNDRLFGSGVVLPGFSGNDVFEGGDGNDELYGGVGNDSLTGDAGDDLLFGDDFLVDSGLGNRTLSLSVSPGADSLDGGQGDDRLYGSGGGDVLIGGQGNDLLLGDDFVAFVPTLGPIDNPFGPDAFIGFHLTHSNAPGNDILSGGDGDDILFGGEGDDTLSGGSGTDYLFGDAEDGSVSGGNDVLDGGEGNDHLDGGSGNDLLLGGEGNDYLLGGEGHDRLEGGDGADILQGGAGNDMLLGESGNDELFGGDGADLLDGGAGNDLLDGGFGSDTYVFGRSSGQDTINEGSLTPEVDTIQMSADVAPTDVVVSRNGGDLVFTLAGTNDQLTVQSFFLNSSRQVELVQFADGTVWDPETIKDRLLTGRDGSASLEGFSDRNDRIQGGSSNEVLSGLAGDDVLDGGGGADLLYGGSGNDTYLFGRGSGRDTVFDRDGTADVVAMGTGIAPADLTVWRSGSHLLLELNDPIGISNTGDHLIFSYFFLDPRLQVEEVRFEDGTVWGVGTLTALAQEKPAPEVIITTDLPSSGSDSGPQNGNSSVTVSGGTALPGTSQSTGVRANPFPGQTFLGTDAADVLVGGLGDDVLDGRGEDDKLYGRYGSDTYLFGRGAGQDVVLENDPTAGNVDTIQIGADLAPGDLTLSRQGADLVLKINGTLDQLTVQSFFLDAAYKIEQVSFADGTLWDQEAILDKIRIQITVPPGGNSATGTNGSDRVTGGPNNDFLFGDQGDDLIEGLDGHDSLFGDRAPRGFDLANPPGNDILLGGAGNDALWGRDGNDRLEGGSGNDFLQGDGGLSGGTTGLPVGDVEVGDDTLLGGDGDDTLYGARGHDLLDGGAGNDYLQGDGGFWGVTGNGNDTLLGGDGNDTLLGLKGDDVLDGGAGDDSLLGGEGSDTYVFGRGYGHDMVFEGGSFQDVNIIRMASDVLPSDVTLSRPTNGQLDLIFRINGTSDELTVRSFFSNPLQPPIQQVFFSDGTVWDAAALLSMTSTMTGTSGDDFLLGSSINETLRGLDGNDALNGAGGADTLIGGLGDDTYFVDSPFDTVIESAGEGTDWVLSVVNFTLPTNVENLTLLAPVGPLILLPNGSFGPDSERTALLGVGNGLDNVLTGNSGDNVLDGGAGNDTLSGGTGGFGDVEFFATGNDLLLGGAGDDTYLFNRGDGIDTIVDVSTPGEGNTLVFGSGISPDSLSLGLGSLLIRVGDLGDAVRLSNFDPTDAYGPHAVETFQFYDGTVLTYSQLIDLGFDIAGTAEDDLLTGTNVTDRITGGRGNDTLSGGAGNDTYFFNVGDGQDTIIDTAVPGEGNSVRFGPGITLASLDFVRDLTSLIILVGSGTDSIRLADFDPDNLTGPPVVETLEFADGTQQTLADLVRFLGTEGDDVLTGGPGDDLMNGRGGNDLLQGGPGNDAIIGGNGDDTLDGGTGNDRLFGGSPRFAVENGNGDDTYLFGRGYGQDVILDVDAKPGNTDTIRLGADVLPGDVTLRRHHADLVLSINGTSDTLTVQGWFQDTPQNQVERIQFSDGTLWNVPTIQSLVIRGTAGDDVLFGYATDDTLDGGAGNDTLVGGAGNDTYRFGRGSGLDILEDQGAPGLTLNAVLLDPDTLPGDVTLLRGGDDLHLLINGTTDHLAIANWFRNDPTVASIQFGDGTVWDAAAIQQGAVVMGNEAGEFLPGTAGNDLLVGGGGPDAVLGGDGHDLLYGGTGFDFLIGENGNDLLDGGPDDDRLFGGPGSDTYRINLGGGFDLISDQFEVILDPQTGTLVPVENTVVFGEGIILDGLSIQVTTDFFGRTTMVIGLGFHDGVLMDRGITHFRFADGSERSWADLVARGDGGVVGDQFGTDSDDVLVGSEFGERIFGDNSFSGNGNDWVEARGGDDFVQGNNGSDVISLGPGNDSLFEDYFFGDPGDDIIAGGTGKDEIFTGQGGDVFAFNRGDGHDRLFEYDFDSTEEEIDTLSFGMGISPQDVRGYLDSSGRVHLLVNGSQDEVEISFWYFRSGGVWREDPAVRIERVQFLGDESPRVFDLGGLVNSLVNDLASATATNPLPLFTEATAGFELTGTVSPAGGAFAAAYARTGDLFGIDRDLTGTAGDDVIRGHAGNDTIQAGAGNDLVYAGAGDNIVETGSGQDVVLAGNGRDLVLGGDGSDYLSTGAGDDTLSGGAGSGDTLAGGTGNDTYLFELGDGIDYIRDQALPGEGNRIRFGPGITEETLSVTQAPNILTITVGTGGDAIVLQGFDPSNATGSLVVEVLEFFDGSQISLVDLFGPAATDGDDDITTGDGDDEIDALAGNDRVDTGAGNDTLIGGLGDDTLIGGPGDDTYLFNLGDGVDTIEDLATPGEGNSLVFGQGITTDDISLGLGSLLIRVGFSGDAIHIENFDPQDAYGSRAIETFQFADGTVLTYREVIDRGFDLTGTAGDDVITGTNVMDRMGGLAGNDLLQSFAGDDLLDGGTGADTLVGGAGDDTYIIDGSGDLVIEGLDEGTDMIQSSVSYTLGAHVEHLTLTGNADLDGTGNELDNLLTGNSGRNVLDGGAGADTLTGGAGDDTYVTDNPGDTVIEAPDEGTDTVLSSVSYALAANVENLTLTGSADLTGTGNELANILTGNGGVNVLVGAAGDDTLIGGQGNDTLEGGAGDDRYLYALGDGLDRIVETGGETGGSDTVVFGAGITFDNIVVRLTESAGVTTAHLRLLDEFGNELADRGMDLNLTSSGKSPIARFEFADGTSFALSDLVIRTEVWSGTKKGDEIRTGRHDDVIYSDKGGDTIYAGTGHDTVYAGKGGDQVFGEGGNDSLYGEKGKDYLDGGYGDDLLQGDKGDDTLVGGPGNDSLFSGEGEDLLQGGAGDDLLDSGKGKDTILFGRGDGHDTLVGLEGNHDDTVLFGAGITIEQLWFRREQNDLAVSLLGVPGSADRFTITDWYTDKKHQVKEFQTADGFELDGKLVDQLIQAMASFGAETGLTWDQALDQRPQDVQVVLAAYWQ